MILTAITPSMIDEEIPALMRDGYRSCKVFMTYPGFMLSDDKIMDVMSLAERQGGTVMVHAENGHCIHWLTARLERAGRTDLLAFGESAPAAVEREATHRAITLAELTGARAMIVHVSSADALEQIEWARDRGLPIMAETCPQYLVDLEKHLHTPGWEAAKHMCSPPPRGEENAKRLWSRLTLGAFKVLSSDHCPWRFEGSEGKRAHGDTPHFRYVPPGVPGLETRLPLLYEEGVLRGRMTAQQFVALTATSPARTYGLYPRKGTLAPGSDADIALWDSRSPVRIRHAALHDACDYSPFEGRSVGAWPIMTISRGERVWDRGWVSDRFGRGDTCGKARTGEPRPVARRHRLTWTVFRLGLCAGAAKSAGVRMVMTCDGETRPRVSPIIDPSEQARLVSLCPGVNLARPEPAAHSDRIWGAYEAIYKSHAYNEEMRFRASSGGVISAICEFLLRTRRVEFILQITTDRAAPMRSRVQLSYTREQVLAAAGARYGPAAPLETIGEALALEVPFAVIGKPCDLAGLKNLARQDPRVDRWVALTVAFFCGGVSSLRISESIVGKYGLRPEEVKTLRYRGHGCPGPTFIEARDGRAFSQTYDETWSEELNEEIQFRCKICPDSIGEHADVVCGDAWATMDGYAHVEHDGWDSVIARTTRGSELLAAMSTARAITLEPLSARDLDRIQPHQVARKAEVLARLAGLVLQGQPRPRSQGMRLARNAWADRARFVRTALGTMRRVRGGANREDTRPEEPRDSGAPAGVGRDPAAHAPAAREAPSRSGYALLGPALVVMTIGVGIPLVMLLVYSLWTQTYVTFDHTPTLGNYARFFERPLYATLLLRSLGVSLATTLATVALAYPMAYLVAFHGGRHRTMWLSLVVVPFWTSYLLRIFAWKVILGYTGVINSALLVSSESSTSLSPRSSTTRSQPSSR